MKRVWAAFLAAFFIFGVITGAVSCSTASDSSKITVAVSVMPQKAFVEAVGGDLIDTVVMIPPGKSPENYEPSPKLMSAFSEADIYFSIGVPAESAYILPIVSKSTKIVALADAVDSVYPPNLLGEGRDPHIWLSPKRVKVMIDVIADKLSELDPSNADTFRQNANNYKNDLDHLDAELRSSLEGVKDRSFIAYHPAFGYVASDYGLKMYALEDGGHEITGSHLAEMIELAKRENIRVIFYQAEISSAQAEAFADEIGGKTLMLDPLSENYIENMRAMAKIMAENMN